MSKIDRMITFVELVEAQSFAACARKLKISTAAVSKQISTLEKELKTDLITRTTRSITLTEIGLEVYESAKRVIKELQDIEMHLYKIQKEPTGKLKVVSASYFARSFIIPHLKEFTECYPKVVLDLVLEERIPDLEKEKVDILIGMSLSGPPDSIQRKIATTRYVFAAAPSYLKRYGTPVKINDLKKHRYITHSMRKPNTTISYKDNKEITIDPVLYVNDAEAMVKAAIQGIGIIKAHEYAVSESIIAGRLVEILPSFSERKIPIWVCFRKSAHPSATIRSFIDFITKIN